jgi:hypothetical protein
MTPFLPYNIVDAAALIIDNETDGDYSLIGAWDTETKIVLRLWTCATRNNWK